MDFQAVENQLNDLPQTFKRPTQAWFQWIDSIASALSWYTEASDGLQAQENFLTATDGWIDVWGTLVGVARRANESNSVYANRIQETILAWRDSVVAITVWIQEIENVAVTVIENLPNVGYQIVFPPTVTINQIISILTNLVYVRPAGVPFLAYLTSGGTFLNTLNYFSDNPTTTVNNLIPITLNGSVDYKDNQSSVHTVVLGTSSISISSGDLLLGFFATSGQGTSLTPPNSSWTQIILQGIQNFSNPGHDFALSVFYKIAGTSESGTYNFSVTGGGVTNAESVLVDFQGPSQSAPIDGAAVQINTSTTSQVAPGVVSSYIGDVLIYGIVTFTNDAGGYTFPLGGTPLFFGTDSNSTPQIYMEYQDVSPGNTGSKTITTGNSLYTIGFSITLSKTTLRPILGRVTGAYFSAQAQPLTLSIPSSTNNALSLLPSLLFTDPTINPSLA